jgi:hypothetical protein
MQDQELNKILKKMWSIKEQIDSGIVPYADDSDYWSENIDTIKNYYKDNYILWSKLWDYNEAVPRR